MHPRRRPVPLPVVLVWTLLLSSFVAGVVLLSEQLRHPLPTEGVPLSDIEQHASDPRDPIECPEPPPREGEDEVPTIGPRDPEPVSVTSSDLVDCPAHYDRLMVRYRGEAVGVVMHRRAGAWTQVNDDIYADAGPLPTHHAFLGGNAGIGVLLPAEAAAAITVLGGPSTQGDVVEVVGTFHRIDPATREVAVIRAAELTVVTPGYEVEIPLLTDRLVAALLLVPLAAGTIGLQLWARRRSWLKPGG